MSQSAARGLFRRALVGTFVLLVLAAAFLPIGSRTESRDGRLSTEYHSVLSLVVGTSLDLPYVLSALLALLIAAGLLLAWRRRGAW